MNDPRTLVLVARGSPGEPRAYIPTFDHGEAICKTGHFDSVRAAFLRGEPPFVDVMDSIEGGECVVVPLFVEEGRYTDEVIPHTLDAHRVEGLTIHYTPPVGTHDAVTDVVVRRAESAVGDRRDGIGLALVGRGSEESTDSGAAIRQHAERIRERDCFEEVGSFFLEGTPLVEHLPSTFDVEGTVAVPVFMAEGPRVRTDIPERIGLAGGPPSGRDAPRIWYTEPVGTDPAVADIALDRALSALDRNAADGTANVTDPS